jgi:hypothetical protein
LEFRYFSDTSTIQTLAVLLTFDDHWLRSLFFRQMKTAIVTSALLLGLFLSHSARSQTPSNTLPQIVQHTDPPYPPLARQTRIQGDVHIEFTTDGASVLSAAAIDGHPLLRAAAETNVRTWKFARHAPSNFFVTFRYKLDGGTSDVEFLEAPGVVRIGGSAPQISDLYGASVDYCVWKLQGVNGLGKFERILEMSCSGQDDEWLDGRLFADLGGLRRAYEYNGESDDEGEIETTDYGHREAGFVAFIVKLRRPGARRTPIFFSGVVKANKIAGTFTDGSGKIGTWNATRLQDDVRRRGHE